MRYLHLIKMVNLFLLKIKAEIKRSKISRKQEMVDCNSIDHFYFFRVDNADVLLLSLGGRGCYFKKQKSFTLKMSFIILGRSEV